ncbi:MAG TPA: RNA polymerase sigma factor [Sphingomonadales bacterium]
MTRGFNHKLPVSGRGLSRDSAIAVGEHPDTSLRHIYDRHDRALRSFLGRILPSADDVGDIAQDVYLRIARLDSLQRLEPNPRAYILQIAKNLVRDRYRRQQLRLVDSLQAAENAPSPVAPPSPEDILHWRQRLDEIKEQLRGLDPEVRRAFLMSRLRDMTYADIAAEMGVSARTVRRYVATAMAHIQAGLAP